MTPRTGVVVHPEAVAQVDGFGEVLTQMLWTAVAMLGIVTVLVLGLGAP